MLHKTSVTILLVLCLCCSVGAATIYVDASATAGTNAGTSWANAYVDLYNPGPFPGAENDVIKIAAGKYLVDDTDINASITVANGVTVRGGYVFDGTDELQCKAWSTVISADINGDDIDMPDMFTAADPCVLENDCLSGSRVDNGNYIVRMTSVANATFDSLVFEGTNGRAGTGPSAFYAASCTDLTVKNCWFHQNSNSANQQGTAMRLNSCTGVIEDCLTSQNSMGSYHGITSIDGVNANMVVRNCMWISNVNWDWRCSGLDLGDLPPNICKVYDCLFMHNRGGFALSHRSYPGDAVVTTDQSILEVYNTVVTDNIAMRGGFAGVACWGSGQSTHYQDNEYTLLKNCLITDNCGSSHGNGVWLYRKQTTEMVNCTISRNSGLDTAWGQGVIARGSSDGRLPAVIERNCIIWGNEGPDNNLQAINVNLRDVTYSCIDDSDGDPNNYTGDGTCITTDPQFVDSDCHLASTSPCIDTGSGADAVGSEPKCNGGVINMGAYGGTVNATPTVDGANTKAGDINCDGAQDLADFQILAGQWLQ